MVTEQQIDEAATALRDRLEGMLLRLEGGEPEVRGSAPDSLPSGFLDPSLAVGPWVEWAACRQHPDMNWMDLELGLSEYWVRNEKRRELAICGICRVREDCLDHALEANEPHGIWGGLLPSERKEVRR